jgi:hypothetical protein
MAGVGPRNGTHQPLVAQVHFLTAKPPLDARGPDVGVPLVHVEEVGARIGERVRRRPPGPRILKLHEGTEPRVDVGPHTEPHTRKDRRVVTDVDGPPVPLPAKPEFTTELHGWEVLGPGEPRAAPQRDQRYQEPSSRHHPSHHILRVRIPRVLLAITSCCYR